jgi:hypothetical protein
MKPYPFASLNHLTVPVAMLLSFLFRPVGSIVRDDALPRCVRPVRMKQNAANRLLAVNRPDMGPNE